MSNKLAKQWLQSNWPNMRSCDVNWTMKKYDYFSGKDCDYYLGKSTHLIKHYYNEHNTLIHFLFGNYVIILSLLEVIRD